jgi:hypothetical protein
LVRQAHRPLGMGRVVTTSETEPARTSDVHGDDKGASAPRRGERGGVMRREGVASRQTSSITVKKCGQMDRCED